MNRENGNGQMEIGLILGQPQLWAPTGLTVSNHQRRNENGKI